LVGAGYFRTEGEAVRAVVDGDLTGYTVQSVRMPPRFHISTHAVMLDGWLFWSYDLKRGGAQVLATYSTSPMWNGTTGPLGGLSRVHANYVGEETVTVPAGRFQAHHFYIDSDSNIGAAHQKVPTSHLWVTGEDNLLVRYDWGGFDLEYVLISLVAE
jgi:hypothetical protein